MHCPLCDHPQTHKHGCTSNGTQRFKCVQCKRTFVETLGTLYYRRQVTPEQGERILQTHAEGTSLRGTSRINQRAYGTVVSLIRAASLLQTHAEGTSLRGTSRINQRAYGTVVSLIRAASQKAQLVHNQEVRDVDCEQVVADEMWSFIKKNRSTAARKTASVATAGLESRLPERAD